MSNAVSNTEIDGRIMALTSQRNDAYDRCVLLQGVLAVANEEISVLKKRIAEMEAPAEAAE